MKYFGILKLYKGTELHTSTRWYDKKELDLCVIVSNHIIFTNVKINKRYQPEAKCFVICNMSNEYSSSKMDGTMVKAKIDLL